MKTASNPKIVVGETTFRSVYADSNAAWKVLKKMSRGVYLCEIVDEPFEHGGKTYRGDYAGTQKAFLQKEIQGSLGMSELWSNLASEHDKFYHNLKVGQIIHYSNGHGLWVRCEVVRQKKENVLKPIALVGGWQSYDLNRRNRNGSVYVAHYPRMIQDGETFTPNSSNLFEAVSKYPANWGQNPQTLEPIDLSVRPMTAEESAGASLWKRVESIRDLIDNDKYADPELLLTHIKSLLQ